jgi:hypothetical protein
MVLEGLNGAWRKELVVSREGATNCRHYEVLLGCTAYRFGVVFGVQIVGQFMGNCLKKFEVSFLHSKRISFLWDLNFTKSVVLFSSTARSTKNPLIHRFLFLDAKSMKSCLQKYKNVLGTSCRSKERFPYRLN